jgi:hypothetical protein
MGAGGSPSMHASTRSDFTPFSDELGSVIVLPSMSFDRRYRRLVPHLDYLEERLLVIALALTNPANHVVFVSSNPIAQATLDHLFGFLPDPDGARHRFDIIEVFHPASQSLAEAVLDQPKILTSLGLLQANDAWILPFVVTPAEEAISARTGLPLYGPSTTHQRFGTKSGARRLAEEAKMATVPGASDIRSKPALDRALHTLWNDGFDRALIKLDWGFAGLGIAIVSAPTRRAPSKPLVLPEGWSEQSFMDELFRFGGVVEAHLGDAGVRSPSALVSIDPAGRVHIHACHEQLIAGSSGCSYAGCRLPIDGDETPIATMARKLANQMTEHNVRGTFSIDFMVGADDRIYANEINLRLGGTTHPLLIQRHLQPIGGSHYIATDQIAHQRLVGARPADLVTALEQADLTYDSGVGAGTVVHLASAAEQFGLCGITVLGRDRSHVDAIYEAAQDALLAWVAS